MSRNEPVWRYERLFVEPQQQSGGSSWDPAQNILEEERNATIANALAQLPDHMQTVINAKIFDGQSFDQIGALMERSPNSVRVIWVRALDRLQNLLAQPSRSTDASV